MQLKPVELESSPEILNHVKGHSNRIFSSFKLIPAGSCAFGTLAPLEVSCEDTCEDACDPTVFFCTIGPTVVPCEDACEDMFA